MLQRKSQRRHTSETVPPATADHRTAVDPHDGHCCTPGAGRSGIAIVHLLPRVRSPNPRVPPEPDGPARASQNTTATAISGVMHLIAAPSSRSIDAAVFSSGPRVAGIDHGSLARQRVSGTSFPAAGAAILFFLKILTPPGQTAWGLRPHHAARERRIRLRRGNSPRHAPAVQARPGMPRDVCAGWT
jgi:hypothetical protein